MALTSCPLYLLRCLYSCCLLLPNCSSLFPECTLHIHTFVPSPNLLAQVSLSSSLFSAHLHLSSYASNSTSSTMLFLNHTNRMPFLLLIVLEIKINCKFLENKDQLTPLLFLTVLKHRTVKTRGNEYLFNSNCDIVFSLLEIGDRSGC